MKNLLVLILCSLCSVNACSSKNKDTKVPNPSENQKQQPNLIDNKIEISFITRGGIEQDEIKLKQYAHFIGDLKINGSYSIDQTITCEGCPETSQFSNYGNFDWIPDETDIGVHEFVFKISSTKYGLLTKKVTFNVEKDPTADRTTVLAFINKNVPLTVSAGMAKLKKQKCLLGDVGSICPKIWVEAPEGSGSAVMMRADPNDKATYLSLYLEGLSLFPWAYDLYYMQEFSISEGIEIGYPRDLKGKVFLSNNIHVTCRGGSTVELKIEDSFSNELSLGNNRRIVSIINNDSEQYVKDEYTLISKTPGQRKFTVVCKKEGTTFSHAFSYDIIE